MGFLGNSSSETAGKNYGFHIELFRDMFGNRVRSITKSNGINDNNHSVV